jgi:hypothetical protein
MLFRITENDVYEDNPHLSLMKEFKGITDSQFRFVCFYSDWQSPYRNLGKEERVARSNEVAGTSFELSDLVTFVDRYYDMQGIKHWRKGIDAIDAALQKVMDSLQDEDVKDADELKKLSASLSTLTNQKVDFIKKVNEHLNLTDMEIVGEDVMTTADEVSV